MEILREILSNKYHRKELVKQFQEQIWNSETVENDILSELAYDLDFYEPDEFLRLQDSSYYGDERLEEEIKSVLHRSQS